MTREFLAVGEIRSAAWNLATRIRYLREEIRGGTLSQDFREELLSKENELARLFEGVGTDIAKLELTVRDTTKANNESGWAFCKRVVIIENPSASAGAIGTASINLLPQDINPDNLVDAPSSEPLPTTYRS